MISAAFSALMFTGWAHKWELSDDQVYLPTLHTQGPVDDHRTAGALLISLRLVHSRFRVLWDSRPGRAKGKIRNKVRCDGSHTESTTPPSARGCIEQVPVVCDCDRIDDFTHDFKSASVDIFGPGYFSLTIKSAHGRLFEILSRTNFADSTSTSRSIWS